MYMFVYMCPPSPMFPLYISSLLIYTSIYMIIRVCPPLCCIYINCIYLLFFVFISFYVYIPLCMSFLLLFNPVYIFVHW